MAQMGQAKSSMEDIMGVKGGESFNHPQAAEIK